MTIVGAIFALLGLLVYPYAIKDKTNFRVTIFIATFLVHLGTTFLYFEFVQRNDADTKLYYYDMFGYRFDDFAVGTQFVILLTQHMKAFFNATYLDMFLFFSSVGFWGIGLLSRVLEEVFESAEVRQPPVAYFMLFLPGLYFWTSAIGKDAPLFFCCCLSAWALMNLKTRGFAFAVAFGVAFLFRPHIALILSASLAISVVSVRNVHWGWRTALIVMSLVAVVAVAPTLQSSLKVDITSSDSIGTFLETQQASGALLEDARTSMTNAPYAVRLFSLLFRPLFFDINSFLGLVASAENVAMIFLFSTLIYRWRLALSLSKRFLYLRFSLVLLVLLIISLSAVWYNVGLGLRQRLMYVPALFVLTAALMAARSVQRNAVALARSAPSGLNTLVQRS